MRSSQNRVAERVAFAAGIALLGYVVAKGFSDQIGVDISAGGRLLFSIVLCLSLVGYAIWNELTDGLLGCRALLPLALSTLWSGFWPAMQYWGVKGLYFPGLSIERLDVEWWASTYMQWGGSAVLLFGGYGIAYWTWRRY
ncbi:hypothetical protein SAMN05216596_107143 [Pseudomonas congelans]|uniref:Integral membrane protein n=1 Tax=Pseudomonas congelans TaxID=200452 RepID=A0A1H0V0F9_9PSED|nr:hypothetical protein SAMN05216596_107143 [Pseudomonas congelans]